MNTNEDIVVYTDGGCSGNPGPGGWGIVVIADGVAPHRGSRRGWPRNGLRHRLG